MNFCNVGSSLWILKLGTTVKCGCQGGLCEHTCRWFICLGFTFVIFLFVGLCQTLPFLWSCMHSLIHILYHFHDMTLARVIDNEGVMLQYSGPLYACRMCMWSFGTCISPTASAQLVATTHGKLAE